MNSKKEHQGDPDQQQQQLQQQADSQTNSTSAPQKPATEPQQFSFGSKQTFLHDRPILIKCPFCLSRIKTQIIMKPELISIMLGLAMFSFFPNAVMIVLVVIVLQISATKRHRCPLCERQLGTDGKFLLFFKDEAYSLSMGENGVLISKKILMTVGLFLLMVFGIYVRATVANTHQWIDLTWNQLIQKCPKQIAAPTCNSENMQKTIKDWKGYVMRVQDRRDSMRKYYDYALQIYVKMQSSQTDKKQPDLFLTSSTSTLYQYIEVIDNLNHGDQIVFNATFYPIGHGIPIQAQNRHLHLVNLNRTGNRREDIQIYMNKNEEVYFEERVDGGALRKQKA